MQTYSIFKYQLAAHKKELLLYYLVMVGVELLAFVSAVPFLIMGVDEAGSTSLQVNGNSMISCILLFVVGICCFRENFNMALQNGVSRKSLLLGRIGATAVLSLVVAAIDELFVLMVRLLDLLPSVNAQGRGTLATFYSDQVRGMFPLWEVLGSVAFSFCLLLAFFGVGYFVGALLYRLGKLGKTIFWIAAAAAPMVLGPGLFELLYQFPGWAVWNVLRSLGNAVVRLAATPWSLGLTGIVIFAAFMALSWLPMRKAQVKRT